MLRFSQQGIYISVEYFDIPYVQKKKKKKKISAIRNLQIILYIKYVYKLKDSDLEKKNLYNFFSSDLVVPI